MNTKITNLLNNNLSEIESRLNKGFKDYKSIPGYDKHSTKLKSEILSNLSDFIAANPSKATQQIRKDLKNVISKVKKSKDPKVLNTLNTITKDASADDEEEFDIEFLDTIVGES